MPRPPLSAVGWWPRSDRMAACRPVAPGARRLPHRGRWRRVDARLADDRRERTVCKGRRAASGSRQLKELSGIHVACASRGDVASLGPRQQDILFKTLQEGLANVVKHAQATRVSLALDVRDGTAAFELADDGVGAAAVPDGRCRGLRQMMERIEAVRGHLTVGATGTTGISLRGEDPAGSQTRAPTGGAK